MKNANMHRLLLLLPLLMSCSLMGLDDIDLPQCQTDEDCTMALNEAAGFYAACHAFACVPDGDRRTCERIEGEICDGFDNDCDYLVDESNGGAQVFSPTIDRRADTPGDITDDIDISSDGDQQVLASWSVQNRALNKGWMTRINATSPTVQQLGYRTNGDDENITAIPVLTPYEPPPGQCGAKGLENGNCEISDVVRSSGAFGTFTATVNVNPCIGGLLRVTHTQTERPAELIDMGPGRRSSVYRGVARVEGTSACSNNPTVACADALMSGTGVSRACGVTRPAVASISLSPAQGLVAFLGAPEGMPTCDGPGVAVEALGVYRRGSDGVPDLQWVDGGNEGVPIELGTSKGEGRPGVLALMDAGYLVAYGDGDGRLALHYIARLLDPPRNDGQSCGAGVMCNATTAEARDGVETPPLPTPIDFPSIAQAFGGQVDNVRLSLGRVMGDIVEVGATYSEGCTAVGSAIVFRRLRLDLSKTGTDMLVDTGSPVRVNAGEQIQGNPALIHLDDGFVAVGYESGDATADDSSLGGFLVAWPSGSNRLLARRISDLTGVPLHPTAQAEFIELSQPPTSDGAMDPDVRSVSFFVDANGPSFAYYDRANTDIAAGVIACPAAEPEPAP
ncbi:MAG: hypothetical protein GXP55_16535 [Deltaproteobacteria bacterium]|nr:hypothetical protein [Deltaproteobacteria bacterium]